MAASLGTLAIQSSVRPDAGVAATWRPRVFSADMAIPDDAVLLEQLQHAIDLRRREDFDRMLDARDPGELV